MPAQADVVSNSRMVESIRAALPKLHARARLESAENEGVQDLLREIEKALPEMQKDPEKPGVMVTSRDKTSSMLQTFLAQRAHETGKVEPAAARALEAKFDSNDILGWFGSFFTWWKKIRPHPWVAGSATPDPFPDVARVALLSDWGTGLYGAPHCAKSIQDEQVGYCMVMHLGDVYYSGDDGEMKTRFLDLWPKAKGAISRGLNGNHEMYTGGKAYYDAVLKQFGQPASYFALQNSDWLLACLDTAYADHDLAGDQTNWLTNLIAQAGDRKVVLFSHHQPFSLMDVQGPKLVQKLQALLTSGRIHSWYWGHEHHCVIYDPHPAWGMRGRCIGHSGFPEFRKSDWGAAPAHPTWRRLSQTDNSPSGSVLDGRNEYIEGHEGEYAPHGYVTLEFENEKMTEIVHQADGRPIALP
jgi:Calcineurin-like phosphoesterase